MKLFPLRQVVAELIATFVLSFVVSISVVQQFPMIPILAALVVLVFVYTIGSISGAHINPAITIGLLSARIIRPITALWYVLAQFIGAALAMLMTWLVTNSWPQWMFMHAPAIGIGEVMGAFLLSFGVCSVVFHRVGESASGLTIGGSLLLGIAVASPLSNGVLNPAVAISVGAVSPMYLLGPIVGAILAAQLYRWMVEVK